MVIELLLLQAAASAVQEPAVVPSLRPREPDSTGQTPLAGAPAQAPPGPSAASVNARDPGSAGPSPLQPPAPVFVRRPAPACADFRPAPGAGWSAAASVEFPGPRGPVQVTSGQIVQPGDYLQGVDLGSILQRDCARTLAPGPAASAPPTG